jgi:hypothetical protein
MAQPGWLASEIMQEHLQNLVSQGYMTAAELATCHVPMDPVFPVSVWIWYTVTPIPSLASIVLWLGAASFDSFRDLAYCGFRNLVRGLHGD